jgi:hypothetical protein
MRRLIVTTSASLDGSIEGRGNTAIQACQRSSPPCPRARNATGSRRPAMDATGDRGKATAPERAPAPEAEGAMAAPYPASDHPFGPDGATILATEHWSRSRHGR